MTGYAGLIRQILKQVESKKISGREAFALLKDLPYKDLGFAKLDNHRILRKGFPEVVYGAGKSLWQLKKILASLTERKDPILVTRLPEDIFKELKKDFPGLSYDPAAGVAYRMEKRAAKKKGLVLVMAAGTSDIPAAEEARLTLEIMGNRVKTLYDVGVAGIHRLLDKKRLMDSANVIIVLAGMEGALASVVAGLVSGPVIAVPTSVGYGASFKGLSALLTMLNCCSPGVSVMNIDNGFGAGYFASLINKGKKA